ncbi:hypothetical protein JQ595_41085 [Bradyrhizobium japonicum]|uniref:hypothetical protein n=1 Tax=Bradyrhizobium japonicum TaxID=375 RepID=UPI001BA8F56C|nr:hypothetical protein [Bradyrhizobium japonicum]MBR0735141.1 hypothetical protein [Bradyrhizobium japonicum]
MANDKAGRELVRMDDPFGDMPVADRQKLMKEIGTKARDEFERLKADLDNQLKPLEPLHCMCSAAFYMVFSISGGAQGNDVFAQHHAELLQALLLRHPLDFYEAIVGTPDQVQAALDLAKHLTTERLKVPYATMPEKEDEFVRARVVEEMRSYTQVIRGEYYPEQLVRLYRPCLVRVAEPFIAQYGIAPATIFDLVRRLAIKIEDRLNEHVKRLTSFISQPSLSKMVKAYKKEFPSVELELDKLREMLGNRPDREVLQQAKVLLLSHSELRIPEIFCIPEAEINTELKLVDPDADPAAAKSIIDKLSMSLGDTADKPIDHMILDNPVWAKPFVKFDSKLYLPLPTTFSSYCLSIFLELSLANDKLKTAHEDARAETLEDMTAHLLREALPTAQVWQSVKWKDAAGTQYENDTVVLIDRWLLMFEAKSGQITDSARRGSYDRLKREIKKLMVEPSEQSLRFVGLLTERRGVHSFQCKGGTCEIDSAAVDGFIRINVTNESIGNLTSRGGTLVEADLVPKGADLAPTMSLSSLDLVLQLISTPNAILHYFARRKPFESTANYIADELDLISLYLESGFNVGENETDGTLLMIYGHSNYLDDELTRSQDKKLGKQPSKATTEFWDNWLNSIESKGAAGWVTAAIRLRNVGKEKQVLLEKPIKHAVYCYSKNGPDSGHAVVGPQSRREGLIYLIRGQEFAKDELAQNMRAQYTAIVDEGLKDALLLLIAPPKATIVAAATVVATEDEAIDAGTS